MKNIFYVKIYVFYVSIVVPTISVGMLIPVLTAASGFIVSIH
jgi:hypothetical protein